MPVQDWTKVEAGVFHAFHTAWTTGIQAALNSGLLPAGYYALAEQHAGPYVTDVLALHASPEPIEPLPPLPPATGGIAVAEAPPKVRRTQTVGPAVMQRRRTLAVRHVSGHRLIALIEIVSPSNKDRIEHLEEFAAMAVTALERGVHLLLVDLFPPGPHDSYGIHGIVRQRLQRSEEPYDLPADAPLTLAAYAAGPQVDIYLEHIAVGDRLPAMPLFLRPDRYVNVPLEPTQQAAYAGMPAFWREVLES